MRRSLASALNYYSAFPASDQRWSKRIALTCRLVEDYRHLDLKHRVVREFAQAPPRDDRRQFAKAMAFKIAAVGKWE